MTTKIEDTVLPAIWTTPERNPEIENKITASLGCSPILSRLLWNRGNKDGEEARKFIDISLSDMFPPEAFSNITEAIDTIHKALRNGEKIAIFGDYDVDGVSSTAILFLFFKLIKADVKAFLPHRVNDGYGLSSENIDQMSQWGAKLIITVDNGISAAEEIAYGRSMGIDFVITDHHNAPENIPQGVAILNPKLPGEKYPFNQLAGAGVAFKLVWAMAKNLSGQTKVSEEFRNYLLKMIGYASLGTIADVVPLLGENRILAYHGLKILQNMESPGIKILRKTACSNASVLNARQISFFIAPRLNAAGRLGTAERALNLLITEDEEYAKKLSQELSRENDRRRKIEQEIYEEALEIAKIRIKETSSCLVLASKNWHVGVIGIAASRISEEFAVPAILIAMDGEEGHGSGRTAGGVSLLEMLDNCSHLLENYGGHTAACGVRIKKNNLDAFATCLNQAIQTRYPVLRTTVRADMILPPCEIEASILNEIEQLSPFGEGNPTPVFIAEGLELVGKPQIMGKQKNHVSFMCKSGKYTFRSVFFGGAEQFQQIRSPITFAYEPFINTYMGFNQIELRIKKIFTSPTAPLPSPY